MARKPTVQAAAPAGGRVIEHDIEREMKEAFLDYSMSVIVSRALPDARDGLKPVHRRVLFAMHELGLTPERAYKKSAMVVGEVLGKYHPHGDSSVYDAIVRMAQDFSMHEPLVDGQGNFGSSDGDSAAAYRYTEVRLTQASAGLLKDIDKETVGFRPTFDGSLKEPVVLPASIPNLLVNGSEGIAVGMATRIPPHNLAEIVEAAILVLENRDVKTAILERRVLGPDFPTGGILYGTEGIKDLYRTGKGRLILRARIEAEQIPGGKVALVVREMPYAILKGPLIQKLAGIIKENGVPGSRPESWGDMIRNLRDESDRDGVRVIIELARGADPSYVRDCLFRKTDLQVTYAAQMIALVAGAPVMLGLKEALSVFLDHRMEIVEKRSIFELRKVRERAHIVDGLLIAIRNIDEVVRVIKAAKEVPAALAALVKRFKISEIQGRAILQMRLSSLTGLDVRTLEAERAALAAEIARLERITGSEEERRAVVRQELKDTAKTFSQPRRTQIVSTDESEADDEPLTVQPTQGIALLHTGEVVAETGKRDKPTGKVTGRAIAIDTEGTATLADGPQDISGTTAAIVSVQEMEKAGTDLVFVLSTGMVKRLDGEEVRSMTGRARAIIKLADNEKIVTAMALDKKQEILIFSNGGKALRTTVDGIPAQGRNARGVAGMKLETGERIVSASPASGNVVLITTKGAARVTPLEEFPVQGRGSRGVVVAKPNDKIGTVASALAVADGATLTVLHGGQISAVAVGALFTGGRNVVPKPSGLEGDVEKAWVSP